MPRRRAGEGGLPGGDEVGRLLATPPARFTAERDALARALAERGDAPGAAALRKLRRPIGLTWVLNRVARERRDDLEALLDAGDRLRAGQRRALAGGGAGALREAEQELRAAARTLRGRAGEVFAEEGRAASPGSLARVELLLRVAATSPGSREALRAGTLSREPDIVASDLGGLGLAAGGAAVEGGAKAAPRGRAPAPPAAVPARTRAAPRARAQAQAETAERAERARAARQARKRARARAAAQRRLEQAERAARAARAAAEAAQRRAEEARARAEAAEAAASARRAEIEALERG